MQPTVPGAVDGWFELHAAFGELDFPELLAPAIEYAERGFAVTEVIAGEWAASAALLEKFPLSLTVNAKGGSLSPFLCLTKELARHLFKILLAHVY